MSPREILAKAMFDSTDRLASWEEIRSFEKKSWLGLADAAMAVSKPFTAAVWRDGFEAGQREYVEGEIFPNPYDAEEN